jgi:hypothetical protein
VSRCGRVFRDRYDAMVSSVVSKLAEPGPFRETIQQHYRAHM